MAGRGAFQDLDLTAVFGDVAASTTPAGGSDHAELAALAVKHAVDARGVAHLVLPDEVQVLPQRGRRQGAGRPAGRTARPAEARAGPRRRAGPGRPPPGARGRPRRRQATGRGPGSGRAARRARPDHVQGQGPDPRHPPARRRGAGPQRDAGGELADERGRPADRGRRVVLQPHRDRAVQDHRADRRRPRRDRPVRRGRRRRPRRRCPHPGRAARRPGRGQAEDQRPDVAARWAIWRAEKARRAADDRGDGVSAAAVFGALSRHLPATRWSPSTSAIMRTRWAATWSRRASRC